MIIVPRHAATIDNTSWTLMYPLGYAFMLFWQDRYEPIEDET